MKKIAFALLIFSPFINLFAQVPSRGAIEKKVKSTIKDEEKNEKEEKKINQRNELMGSTETINRLFENPFIFTDGYIKVSGDKADDKETFIEEISRSNNIISQYLSEINQFLSSKPSKSAYENYSKKAEAKASAVEYTIKNIEKELKSGNSYGGVYYLQELHQLKGYFEAQLNVFPTNLKIKEGMNQAKNALTNFGNSIDFLDKMEDNKKNQAKNLTMVPAAQQNPKLQELSKKEYEKVAKNKKVSKVNITETTWRIEKNEFDIPLNRKIAVCLAITNEKGECGIVYGNLYEEYIGGGNYGETIFYLPSDPIIVPCENIK